VTRTRLATEADAAAIARISCAAADRRTVRSEDYADVAEFSVYVDRANRGTGAGRAAMEALVVACEKRGLHKLVSRVYPENEPSRRLLARVGFREVGTYRRHSKLGGEWRDTVIVERLIGAAAR